MSATFLANLKTVVNELVQGGTPIGSEILAKLAAQISKGFGVREDEVALMALGERDRILVFLVPTKLHLVGNIPMTSTNSVAVRTARDKRPEIINNFANARHPTVFEGVPLGERRGDPIQKIMSAPLTVEGRVVGVIQICRKGKTSSLAGPDFTPKELTELVAVAGVISRCVLLATIP